MFLTALKWDVLCAGDAWGNRRGSNETVTIERVHPAWRQLCQCHRHTAATRHATTLVPLRRGPSPASSCSSMTTLMQTIKGDTPTSHRQARSSSVPEDYIDTARWPLNLPPQLRKTLQCSLAANLTDTLKCRNSFSVAFVVCKIYLWVLWYHHFGHSTVLVL